MLLRRRTSRARAPLLCLGSFSWFIFLLVIPVRFKGTVKRVKKSLATCSATFPQHELNSDNVARFTTSRTKTFQLYLLHWMVKRRNETSPPPPSDTLSARSFSWRQCPHVYQELWNKESKRKQNNFKRTFLIDVYNLYSEESRLILDELDSVLDLGWISRN